MILPCGKNIDIIPNFRFEAQVDAATKSGSHDFHFTVHFCNSAVSQRGEVAALICIREVTTVVGYQQKETVTGFNFVIPTFAAVNGGSINIQDIKISGATDWADNIQILDEGGATVSAYVYASAEQSGAG